MNQKILLCTMMVVAFLLTACPSTRAKPTPDIEATVNARLTEAAIEAIAPTATDTPEPTTEVVAPQPACTVVSNSLNLRAGPDTNFDVLTVLTQGAVITPQKVNDDRTWVWVDTAANEAFGWINAASQYIDCTFDISTLPIDNGPPTPTPTPVPDVPPTPTYTPTAIAQVVVPRTGGGDGDLRGDVLAIPSLISGPSDFPIFSENLSLQVAAYDPNANEGNFDGAGIERVEITIFDADEDGNAGDRLLYSTTESTPAFCSFGGNGPCEVLNLGHGATWPGSGRPIESGTYSINFRVVPKRQASEGGDWRIRFRIQRPGDPPPNGPSDSLQNPPLNQRPNIIVNIAELFRGREFVFQVEAFDPSVGSQDGDGIERVELRIFGPNGREIYQKTENSAAYCAFGGDHPCPTGDLSFERGVHTLQATVFAKDGRIASLETQVTIE